MRTRRRHSASRWLAATAVLTAVAVVPTGQGNAEEPAEQARSRRSAPAPAAPRFTVRTVVTGLDHPWDIAFTPNRSMLITQRNRGNVLIRRRNGNVRALVPSVPGLWVNGETGLTSVAVDPGFNRNRRFYLCHGFTRNGKHDVRVTAWRANDAVTSARQVDVLIKGMPSTSGRHGGCRLTFGGSGALYIGTGDAARSDTPRNLGSYGGKVLKVNPANGNAMPNNPFINSNNSRTRKLWTYGHRNVQGLATRPGGSMWSVEHGPDRNDEVNRLRPGGDYGWQPGPGYDESRPMTDFNLPGPQVGARWKSGFPTVATSGATWLTDPRWGGWRRTLAIASLKDRSLRVMRFGPRGGLKWVARPGALAGDYGRLRSAELGRGGSLYLTTDNGSGNDRVIVVIPQN